MNSNDQRLPWGNASDRFLPMAATAQLPYDFGNFLPRAEEERGIDLWTMWLAVYRNRYLILAILGLSLVAGVASLMLIPPTYRATATVEIDAQPVKVLGTEDVEPINSGSEMDRFLQTQVDILKSRDLAARVAESEDLYGNDRFLAAEGRKPAADQNVEARRSAVINALQSNLDVNLPKTSRVVDINFDSGQPAVAAKIANSYAENFISGNLQRRFETSAYSRDFLQKQLGLTKVRLERSERALIAYARSAGLLDASGGAVDGGQTAGPRSLTTANLVQLNAAYSAARSERVQAQQRWEQAQSTPLMSLPEVLSNPAISQLTQKRAELEAQYQQELQRRKPEYPSVQQAAAQLQELDRQIATIARSIRDSIRDRYRVAARQEAALQNNVDQLKTQTLSEQDRGVRYNILKREVDTNRELYDGLLQRYKEISAQAGITNNNISIVDRAVAPSKPVAPRPIVNMAVAGLGGLALALLVVFGREMFDDSVRDPADVADKFGLPLLGTTLKLKRRSVAEEELTNPKSMLSEGYHAVRAALELSSGEGAPATLVITSSRSAEGKSTSALAIARDFAMAGKKVLLVDADLRSPSLHVTLRLLSKPGLSNILAQHKNLDEVIQETDAEGLSFLAAGSPPPNPAALLARDNFANFIAAARSRFDQVIIDGPPVLGLADGPQLAAVADGTIMVIEAGRSQRGAAKGALRRLLAARANVVGAVLTKFDPRGRQGAYDGYYAYGYSGDRATTDGEPPLLDTAADDDAPSDREQGVA